MKRQANGEERQNRIELIGRVQLAYEQLKEAIQRNRSDSPKARAAVFAARRRFSLLNRALAMVALQGMQTA
jgi:hypothetical protein